jgi:4-alpha-glucanotransferase
VRSSLGQLVRPEAEEQALADREKEKLVALLRAEGFVDGDPSLDELILGLHRLLAATPSTLVAVSPYDAVGEVRQPNLPGTMDEYPNWRIPLPVTIDDLFDDGRVRAIVDIVNARVRSAER